MSVKGGPNIVKDGMVLCLDAANTKSYPGTGTKWYDQSGNNNTSTHSSGVTYNSSNMGSLVFNGIDTSTTFTPISYPITLPWSFTMELNLNSDMIGKWTNIIDQVNGFTNCTWMFHSEGLAFYQSYYNSTTWIWWTGIKQGTTLAVNTWNSITITCAPVDSGHTNMNAYLNGIRRTDSSTANFLWSDINHTMVFDRIGGGATGRWYSGKVATLKVYNRILSADEVFQNYNATKSRYNL